MVLAVATNYPLLAVFWTMLEFFAFVIFIFLVFTLATDIFRSDDLSGWAKAAWLIFIVFIPVIGIFAYLIARGRSMQERTQEVRARQLRQQEVMSAHLTAQQASAEAIVILGGGYRRNAPEVGGDAPNAAADLRLIEGAKIARATNLPILVSGSAREANAMRHFVEDNLQIPVRWVEAASGDTHENAVNSARILRKQGIERIILVTSSAHLVRAVAEFAGGERIKIHAVNAKKLGIDDPNASEPGDYKRQADALI